MSPRALLSSTAIGRVPPAPQWRTVERIVMVSGISPTGAYQRETITVPGATYQAFKSASVAFHWVDAGGNMVSVKA